MKTLYGEIDVEPYDVLQVWHNDMWMDYATLATVSEVQEGLVMVRNSSRYRIVGKGLRSKVLISYGQLNNESKQ